MAVTDGFLRAVPSDANARDGRLYDPTAADGATYDATVAESVSAAESMVALAAFTGAWSDALAVTDAAIAGTLYAVAVAEAGTLADVSDATIASPITDGGVRFAGPHHQRAIHVTQRDRLSVEDRCTASVSTPLSWDDLDEDEEAFVALFLMVAS